MRRTRIAGGPCLLALGLAIAPATRAQDEPARPAPASDPFRDSAVSYRIALESSKSTPLTFRDQPVLRWTNPERKTDDGSVFVWTDRGRPEVAACFYRYRAEGKAIEEHEFVSLSESPLAARRDGEPVWSVAAGNIHPAPIPDAPSPAASPAERLRQMRALAREFKATFNNPPDLSEIRLLSQPLYRFETEGKRADILDGALFAYVHTTDPEVLLLIEARPPAGGGPVAWHFSVARMSMVNLRVHHKGREVWSASWANDLRDPTSPYMARSFPSARP